jgi:predicted MFS family arabinose efflux permease
MLAFRFASFVVSEPAGDHVNRLLPLRFQQIASFWRLLAVASMGLIALLPNGLWCLTGVLLLLVVSGISNGITGVTGPVAASATVSDSKQPKAYLLTMAASLGGTGLGAWLAAILVPTLGFPLLFGIGALVVSIALLLWHRA